ncbi:MAG: hypothetical protein ABJB05_01115 [Parafilimonas sp.]
MLKDLEDLNLIELPDKDNKHANNKGLSTLKDAVISKMSEAEIDDQLQSMRIEWQRDTSAIIKYLNQTFPAKAISFISEIIHSESNISFITEIELQVWNPSNPKDIHVYLEFIQSSNLA